MLEKLFRIPTAMRWTVAAMIVLLIVLWSVHARGSELVFSGGGTVGRGYAPVIGLDVRWPLSGPANTDYELGMRLVGESTYREAEQSNQIIVHASLADGWKAFQAGLGMAYLANTDAYNGGHVNYRLFLRWVAHERVRLSYEHFSCAGSCDPNLGRDMVLVGWRF